MLSVVPVSRKCHVHVHVVGNRSSFGFSRTRLNRTSDEMLSRPRGASGQRVRARARRPVQLILRRQAGADASCISRSTMSSSTSAKNAPTTSSISLNPSAQNSTGW